MNYAHENERGYGQSDSVHKQVFADPSQIRKCQRTMHKMMVGVTVCIVAFAMGATAQTVNQIPKYQTSTTFSDSPISVSGGNVGIGTTAPLDQLDVRGGNILVGPFGTQGVNYGLVFSAPSANNFMWISNGSPVGDPQNGYLAIGVGGAPTNSSERMRINSSGNVGIGTATPSYPLDVWNTSNEWVGRFYNGYSGSGGAARIMISAGTTSGTNAYAYSLRVGGTGRGDWANSAFSIVNENAGTYPFVIANTGNVGIGTPHPQYNLDVTGVVNAQAGVRFPDGNTQTVAFNPYDLNVYQLNSGGNGINLSIPTTGNAPFVTWQTADSTNNVFSMRFWGGAGAGWAIGNGNASGFSPLMTILTSGNVGIGTTNPGASDPNPQNGKLEVNGDIVLTNKVNGGGSGNIIFADGTTQHSAYTGVICGGDYAESVDVTGSRTNYEPGDVLVIDSNAPGKFLKSNEAYSTLVTGIYSTKPGTVGRRQTTTKSQDEVPMAMVGIVPTKVSAENGPIKTGDLLVASSTLGYAMKGTDRSKMLGAVIGKALGNIDSGTGVIEVVVTLQ